MTAAIATDRGLFVYGVVPADAGTPTGLTGVDESAIELVHAGRVAAVVGSISLDRAAGRRAELLAYQTVLDALAEAGPVAPVRFGSVLADAQAVAEEFLLPQEDDLVQLLADLDGRRQFNLRATYVEDVVLGELVLAYPEIRELRERTRDLPEEVGYADRVRLGELVARVLEARSADDAQLLLDAVVPRSVAHVVRATSDGYRVLDVALLVDDSESDELVDVLEGLAEAMHERVRLRLLGPMAPYDFAGGG